MRRIARIGAAAALAVVLGSFAGAGQADAAWGAGSAAATTGDCDPGVQRHQDQLTRAGIDNYTALAGNLYTPMPEGGFSGMSCLDRLMNSGINGIFNIPSIEDILNQIANGLCAYGMNLVQQTMSSLSQSVSQSIPLGEVIPGVNLGSIGGGFSVAPTMYNSSGNLVNVSANGSGVRQVQNLAGRWGGTPYAVGSYGTLYGHEAAQASPASGSGGWFGGISNFFGR